MGVSHISNTNSGKAQYAAAAINGEPNWSIIPTAGKSSKTKTEFVNEIKELARKAALTLVDYLEDAEGKISSLAEKKFALAGGGTLTCLII